MKVVILASGFETRIVEESQKKPKPLISIGLIYALKKFFEINIIC